MYFCFLKEKEKKFPRKENKMKKLTVAYILGILSFVMAITGIFSLFLSIPGLLLSIISLKMPEKRVVIPLGYQGTVGRKKISARPFVTTRYLSFVAIGLNSFSIAISLFAAAIIAALFTAGTR